VELSQTCHQLHSPKHVQFSKQIFQFTANFPFTLKLFQETSTLFNIQDKSSQLELFNFCQLFKVIFIPEDK
jgi:hypothetical protein